MVMTVVERWTTHRRSLTHRERVDESDRNTHGTVMFILLCLSQYINYKQMNTHTHRHSCSQDQFMLLLFNTTIIIIVTPKPPPQCNSIHCNGKVTGPRNTRQGQGPIVLHPQWHMDIWQSLQGEIVTSFW